MLSSPGAASADICSPHGHESAQQPGSTFAMTGTVAAVPAPSTPLIAAAQAVSCVSGTPGAPTAAHGCVGASGAATTSSGGSASCGSSGASSRRTTASMLPGSIIGSESAADATQAQAQLTRMQEAWRESVEKDVSCLREVLGQYKEQVERLEMQKRLLLSQVLKLEFALEEEEARADALEAAVMRGGGTGTASAAAAAAVGDTSIPQAPALSVNTSPPLGVGLGAFDAASDDGWAATPTVGSLLPRIVSLWQELYVPLAYRSRFFLAFRGREVFYYEVEARRLEWKRAQMLAGAPDDGGSGWQDATLARRSAGAEGSTGTGTPPCGTGGSTPRPCSSAAAAAALTASSTFTSGTRRRSRQLDKAARCERSRACMHRLTRAVAYTSGQHFQPKLTRTITSPGCDDIPAFSSPPPPPPESMRRTQTLTHTHTFSGLWTGSANPWRLHSSGTSQRRGVRSSTAAGVSTQTPKSASSSLSSSSGAVIPYSEL